MASSTPKDLDLRKLPDTFLKCCQCSVPFDDQDRHPRLLSCLHCVCFHCLQENSRAKEWTKCLHCNERFSSSKSDFSDFPRDNTKNCFLKFIRLKDAKFDLTCEECENDLTANSYCETCSKMLCKECFEYHKRAKRSHNMYCIDDMPWSLESVGKFSSQGKCRLRGHQDKTLEFFCDTCDILVCSKCALTIHKETNGHHILESQDVFESKSANLVSEMSLAEEKKAQVDKTINAITNELDDVDLSAENASKEINLAFDRAIKVFQEKRNELLSELRVLTYNKKTTLKNQMSNLGNQKKKIENACNFVHCSLASSDISAIMQLSPTISNRLRGLNQAQMDKAPREKACIKFLDANFKVETSTVGKLQSSRIYGPKTKVSTNDTTYAGKDQEIYIRFYDYDGHQVTSDISQVAACIADDKDRSVGKPIPCLLQMDGTWSCTFKLSKTGLYSLTLSVFGFKMDMEPIAIDVESFPVVASAQVPVKENITSSHDDESIIASTVEVRGVSHQTIDNTIKSYFVDSLWCRGGEIESFARYGDVVFISFEKSQDLQHICTMDHVIDGTKVIVTYHLDQPFLKPKPFSVTADDYAKIQFLKNSKNVKKELEERLQTMYIKVEWPTSKTKVINVSCTLTSNIKDCVRQAIVWTERAKKTFEDIFEALSIHEFTIMPTIWEQLMQALESVSISQPDKVAVIAETEKYVIKVVGYKVNETMLSLEIQNLIEKLKRKPKY